MTAKKMIWFESTNSTNSEAFNLIDSGAGENGKVVATLNQTGGRGQGSSSWESEPGKNLTFSIILRPTFIPPAQQFILNQAISLGLRDGVESISKIDGFKIKWSNDIYFDRFKIAGILIENRIIENNLSVSVVGIGLNLNQEKFVSDAPNPISLKNICGKEFDLDESLTKVIGSVFDWYNQLEKGNYEHIKSTYLKYLLGFGVSRQFMANNEKFFGEISGVDKYGRLLVKKSEGKTETFDFKEITFLH